jgi:hypothetical protein
MSDPSVRSPTRRAFLQLAAVAPLAAMGCAGWRAGPSRASAGGPDARAADPLAAVRAVALPSSAEPALVFRALGGRGRCG